MIWQPKLFLYEGNNFNHQNHLEIIKIKEISLFFMNSSSNPYYNLSIVYSNQHKFIILLHKIIIKMYIDDDTQKEKTIIPSLGGGEDVSMGRSSYFQLLEFENSILIEKGIESCYYGSKEINPWWFKTRSLMLQPRIFNNSYTRTTSKSQCSPCTNFFQL